MVPSGVQVLIAHVRRHGDKIASDVTSRELVVVHLHCMERLMDVATVMDEEAESVGLSHVIIIQVRQVRVDVGGEIIITIIGPGKPLDECDC